MPLPSFPWRRERPLPILVVLHQKESCPGHLGRAFAGLGHSLDFRRPRFGDALPSSLEGHAGVVVMGGPMSANDPDDWMRREIDWLSVPLREGRPLLGICLGAQMLSKHLGGKVYRKTDGSGQIGHHPLHLTDHGRDVLGTPPSSTVFHWHREGFTVPETARLLAFDDDFAQGFSYGETAVGLQFHPEVDETVIGRWMSQDPEAAAVKGARPFASYLATHRVMETRARRWVKSFAGNWVGQSRERTGQAPAPTYRAAGELVAT